MNVLELYHHSLLLEEGDALHHKPQGGFCVTPGLLLQFFTKKSFRAAIILSLNSFGGAKKLPSLSKVTITWVGKGIFKHCSGSAMCCGSGGERISRHNHLRDHLHDTAVAAGLGPVREVRFLIPGTFLQFNLLVSHSQRGFWVPERGPATLFLVRKYHPI